MEVVIVLKYGDLRSGAPRTRTQRYQSLQKLRIAEDSLENTLKINLSDINMQRMVLKTTHGLILNTLRSAMHAGSLFHTPTRSAHGT